MSALLDRRAFLERAALLGAATMAGGVFVTACSKPAFACMDVTGLSEEEVAKRAELQYVDATTRAGMNCVGCQFYTAAAEGACGGCTILAGPIHPEGWCSTWAAKA
jgi:hypothetical protein